MVSFQEPFVIYFKMYSAYSEMYHYLLYYDMYFMVQSLFIIPLETTWWINMKLDILLSVFNQF